MSVANYKSSEYHFSIRVCVCIPCVILVSQNIEDRIPYSTRQRIITEIYYLSCSPYVHIIKSGQKKICNHISIHYLHEEDKINMVW
jgi:hypothetical protein